VDLDPRMIINDDDFIHTMPKKKALMTFFNLVCDFVMYKFNNGPSLIVFQYFVDILETPNVEKKGRISSYFSMGHASVKNETQW
jgi:hypothetical protein